MLLSIVVGEMRPPQREACRQAVMALALEAVLRPVLKVCHPLPCSLCFAAHSPMLVQAKWAPEF